MAESTKSCVICFCDYASNYFAQLPCEHEFCFFCLKSTINAKKKMNDLSITPTSPFCPICRQVIPPNFEDNFTKLISKEELESIKCKSKWMYSGNNGGWWFYQEDIGEVIEEAWVKYVESEDDNDSCVDVMIHGDEYKICFKTMKQKSKECSWKTRNIKREENASLNDSYDSITNNGNKGIAGIRYITSFNNEENSSED